MTLNIYLSFRQFLPSKHLPAQSKQQWHEKKVKNMFRAKIKVLQRRNWRRFGVFIVNFVHNFTCNFIKKETSTRVYSCEFCKISKNTFFTEHHWATASAA